MGGLTIYPVANFLECIYAKNYENWLAVDEVIPKIIIYLAHPIDWPSAPSLSYGSGTYWHAR